MQEVTHAHSRRFDTSAADDARRYDDKPIAYQREIRLLPL